MIEDVHERVKEVQKDFLEYTKYDKEDELYIVYFHKIGEKYYVEDFLSKAAFERYKKNNKIKNEFEEVLFMNKEKLKELLFEDEGVFIYSNIKQG